MEPFIHLHVHTQYSLLDGQASVDALLNKAIEDGMPSLAITDHGNMYAIKEFSNRVKSYNKSHPEKPFLPIFGCECYCAHYNRKRKEGREDLNGWHLILLAKNEKGYHNLIKMVSLSWTEGFYGKPRIDKELLEKYHEGIICSSACLGGEIPKKILSGQLKEVEASVSWFKKVFGDDYYLELQRHKTIRTDANQEVYPLQEKVNKVIVELSAKFDVKLIATNDVHFVNEEDAEAHDRLICLSTGKDFNDPKRLRYTKQEWFKTTAEMNELFSDHPEALANTIEIANKVEPYTIESGPIMPTFAIPVEFGTEDDYRKKFTKEQLFDEFTQDEKGNVVLSVEDGENKIKGLGGYDKLYRIKLEADYLKELTYKGARVCYGETLSEEIIERLEFELYIMKTMGFPGYFLIVQDFIAAAREKLNVSVGPGRGSAAGSAVAYCLGITRIDPIKYDLLFERFLNPDRISLPDIDTDFDDDGRGDVLRWVTDKYGEDRVAHIITYGTMAAKSAIKDVARVEKLPLSEANHLAKLVPDKLPGFGKFKLKDAVQHVEDLKRAANSTDVTLRNTLKYAQMLEGNVRNVGMHACGVIIGRYDISDVVPVCIQKDKETGKDLLVTQYDGSVIEETGLIKMDFLGLKTLSIIKDAIENIKLFSNEVVDIDKISLNDPKTFALYCSGNTTGTFQFESSGMQKYLKELQPSKFEDLIAMNALYRPGPMDNIPSFIARKHGREKIVYDIPVMERYLKDTYGITVYQEQVMLLSRLLANFTRGQSDTLRKAMGKKLIDKMKTLYKQFLKGGKENGYKEKVLEKIWSDWEKFASYAFNKSHATCYSWVAYQTAYLKANYPSAYMAAVLSRNISDITTLTKFMDECKAMDINVLGPEINESNFRFSVNKEGNIRFGLGGVKGVGNAAVQNIIEERKKRPFDNIYDFVERVNLSACSKKCIESLALAGAFDSMGIEREAFFTLTPKGEPFIEVLMRYGNKYQADKDFSSNSIFGDMGGVEVAKPEIPECQRWGDLARLNKEKELVGMYLSAHPLDKYKMELSFGCKNTVNELSDLYSLKDKGELSFGGIVSDFRSGTTKNGKPYGILKIEDFSGSNEIPLFGQSYIDYSGFCNNGYYLFIRASVEPRTYNPDQLDLKIASMQLLQDVKDTLIRNLLITLPIQSINDTFITELDTLVNENPGDVLLYLNIYDADFCIKQRFYVQNHRISITPQLMNFLQSSDYLSFKINVDLG